MDRKAMDAAVVVVTVALSLTLAAQAMEPQKPPVDEAGKFWLYGEMRDAAGETVPRPEVMYPVGWMPEEAVKGPMLDKDRFVLDADENPAAGRACWRIPLLKWVAPNWCGVACITAPDTTWWEPKESWRAYDLSGATQLCFSARGDRGDEVIQIKIGILGDKGTWGDSTAFPIETKWFALTTEWKQYVIPLTAEAAKRIPEKDRLVAAGEYAPKTKRIVNPFTLILARDRQKVKDKGFTIYFDDIYYQMGEARGPQKPQQ